MLIIIMVFKDQYVNKEKSFVFFVLYSSMINFKIPKGGGVILELWYTRQKNSIR